MSKAAHLRAKADLYRRVASTPTEGGRREDRVLLIIADNLEREAATLEEHGQLLTSATDTSGADVKTPDLVRQLRRQPHQIGVSGPTLGRHNEPASAFPTDD